MRVTWLALEWPRVDHHSGGVGRYLARLGERMRELVDLTVVAYADAVPMDGVRLMALTPPTSRLDRFYLSPARARREVARSRPDVLHAHGDDWLAPGSLPWVRSFYGSAWSEAMASSGLRRANHLVLAGTEAISAHRSDVRLGIAPESVDRFNCEVVFPPYLPSARRAPRAPAATPEVAFIGSHLGRKRGYLVQDAVAQLNADRAQPVTLTVVGPAADAGSWAPWVRHLSGLDDPEVQDVLARAWCLAAPSEYEGFGIPTVEALAQGVAVVASHNPGTDYLQGLVDHLAAPLTLVADVDLGSALSTRLERGPKLAPEARDLADRLVQTVSDLGSPQRLLNIYERVTR